MSKQLTWRQRARASLDRAYAAAQEQGLTGTALEQAIFDSYPFGERAYTPYKVWLEERKRLFDGWQLPSERKVSAAEQRERELMAAWNAGEPLKVGE